MESIWRRRMVDFAVVACFYSGGVHLQITPHHLAESRFAGTLFLLDGAFFIAIATWLSIRASAMAWRAAGILAMATTLAYATSRTVGIPGMHAEPWDVLGLSTSSLQLAIAGIAVAMIGLRRLTHVNVGRMRMLAGALLIVVVAGAAYAVVPATGFGTAGNDVDGHSDGVMDNTGVVGGIVEMESDGITGNAAVPAEP